MAERGGVDVAASNTVRLARERNAALAGRRHRPPPPAFFTKARASGRCDLASGFRERHRRSTDWGRRQTGKSVVIGTQQRGTRSLSTAREPRQPVEHDAQRRTRPPTWRSTRSRPWRKCSAASFVWRNFVTLTCARIAPSCVVSCASGDGSRNSDHSAHTAELRYICTNW